MIFNVVGGSSLLTWFYSTDDVMDSTAASIVYCSALPAMFVGCLLGYCRFLRHSQRIECETEDAEAVVVSKHESASVRLAARDGLADTRLEQQRAVRWNMPHNLQTATSTSSAVITGTPAHKDAEADLRQLGAVRGNDRVVAVIEL